MNTKPLPAIIMLGACGISCAMSIYQKVDFNLFTVRLAVSAIVFMIIGTVVKMVLDYACKVLAEGEEPVDVINTAVENIENSDELTEETEQDEFNPEGFEDESQKIKPMGFISNKTYFRTEGADYIRVCSVG